MADRVDPHGTAPGLAPAKAPQPKTINMKCKRDNCPSMEVIEVTPKMGRENAGAPHARTYQCVKCHHSWVVPVGGFVNF
jgi:DNA-directed RNA polymerase subunit M/transcription elongation factor TFIIS